MKGLGNQQDYGMRIYDPRIGRFLSVDPLTKSYPWYTPYQFAGDNPIKFVDVDGLEPWDPNKYVNSDAPSVDPKYKNVNLNQPKPKIEGAANVGWNIIKNALIAAMSLTEIPAAAHYGDKVQNKAKAFPVTHGSAVNIVVAPAAIAMELKKNPGNEEAWAQAALFVLPFMKVKAETIIVSAPESIEYAMMRVDGAMPSMSRGVIMKSKDLKLGHSESTILKAKEYQDIKKLTDDELIKSVLNPSKSDPVTINANTGRLSDGNTRIYEIQRRKLDVDVPVKFYYPDETMFPSPKEPPKKNN